MTDKVQKYAVIKIGGQQFKVSEGQKILVGKLKDVNLPAGKAGKVEPEVLLVADGEKVKVGKPKVAGAKVVLKVVAEVKKGEKIEIYKFKAKARYRKHTGFRPQYSELLVDKITI